MAPLIKTAREFDREAPVKPSSGMLKKVARELGPVAVDQETNLLLPRSIVEDSEVVRAKDGRGVMMQTLEIATGTKKRGERQTRKARWAILTYCASLLEEPVLVKDGLGNIIRNDGEGSKDYGVLELDGAIRMLLGADLVR